MEKEFDNYWKNHQLQFVAHAPQALKAERDNTGKLNTAGDWILMALPVVAMVAFMEYGVFANEMLNFVVGLGVGVLVFAVSVYIKPWVTGKRHVADIDEDIKQHFYKIYREHGLGYLRTMIE